MEACPEITESDVCAAISKGPNEFSLLLARGLDPIAAFTGTWRDSPAALTAKFGSVECLELCLENLAPHHWEKHGPLTEALRIAVKTGHFPLLEVILKHAPSSGQGSAQWLLSEAVRFGRHSAVDFLLEKGADPLGEGRPLVQMCFEAEDLFLFNKLLHAALASRGALPPQAATDALAELSSTEDMPTLAPVHKQIALQLLDQGALPMQEASAGRSPLRLACLTLNFPVLEAMLERGMPLEPLEKMHQRMRQGLFEGSATERWITRQAWLENWALSCQVLPAPAKPKARM